jgi:hypothetical protein
MKDRIFELRKVRKGPSKSAERIFAGRCGGCGVAGRVLTTDYSDYSDWRRGKVENHEWTLMDTNGGKDFYHGLRGAHGLEAGMGGRPRDGFAERGLRQGSEMGRI